MNRVPIPDNIHFYKKNENNVLSVNLTLTGDQAIGLDYSKSLGQSEVAINLLGLPREETRQVLYEDVPSYGFDRNRWTAIATSRTVTDFYDVNYGQQAATYSRLAGKRKDIAAGFDSAYDPDALNYPCPADGAANKDKFFKDRTFAPIVYQDPEMSCIVMEGWPAKEQINVYVDQPCVNPQKFYQVAFFQESYYCRLESKETYRYEPGKIMGMTFGVATSVEGVTGRDKNGVPELKEASWGAFNNTDSYYFKLKGDRLFIGRKSLYAENAIEISKDKFLDPLDGSGPSGIKIDFSKVTMYSIEFSWYGAIGCSFFAYLPYETNKTKWVKIADLPASNTFSKPALADPYMKMFMEVTIPHGVTKPQFLRKHGTSVYVDGGSVDRKKTFAKSSSIVTPLKTTSTITGEKRNIMTLEVSEKYPSPGVGQYNKTKIFPINIQAFFNNSVMLEVTVNNKSATPTPWITMAKDGKPNRNIYYPICIWKLPDNRVDNDLFFNYSGGSLATGWTRPVFEPIQGTTFVGSSGEFRENLFDYVFNLSTSMRSTTGNNSNASINLPPGVNADQVIRDLLNAQPLMYDRSIASRTTLAWNVHNKFNTNLNPEIITLGYQPNWVYGLNNLPVVKSVRKNSDTNLTIQFNSDVTTNNDGVYKVNFPTADLDPAFLQQVNNQFPNYSANHHGNEDMFLRTFGGFKTVTDGSPLYSNTTCKLCLKKSFLRNDSFYILNVPFDTGRINFVYPITPFSIFCIQKPFIDYLQNNNWFNTRTFGINTVAESWRDNAIGYLEENAEFRCSSRPNYTETISYRNGNIFKITDQYYWWPDQPWAFLKTEYRPVLANVDNVVYPFELKFQQYKTQTEQRTGMDNKNPGEPYEGNGEKSMIVSPLPIARECGIAGFDIKRFKFRVNIRSSTKQTGGGWKRSRRAAGDPLTQDNLYQFGYEDVQYLNEDGVYVVSNTFFLIFLNNLQRLTGCTKLIYNGQDVTFNNLYLSDTHTQNLSLPEARPFDCLLSFRFNQGNPPPAGFFSLDSSKNLDLYKIFLSAPSWLGPDTGSATLEGEFRAVTCLYNEERPVDNVANDDIACLSTYIIGASANSPLYFGFSIKAALSATGSKYNYRGGKMNMLTTTSSNGTIPTDDYDFAMALTNIYLKDFNGNVIQNTGSLYSNNIERTPIIYAGPPTGNPQISSTSQGTRWSNNYEKLYNIRARAEFKNNDTINQTEQTLNKFNFIVLPNRKTLIDLTPIFSLSKVQALPSRFGSAAPYESTINISARSLVPNTVAQGITIVNFEETL